MSLGSSPLSRDLETGDKQTVPFPTYDEGLLDPPRYLPPHFADLAGLASWLAYSGFRNQVGLDRFEDDDVRLL